jgi:predicted PurR-regulated permease PerM
MWKLSRVGRNCSRKLDVWLSKNRVVTYLSRASVKSAAIVLLVFVVFVLVFIVLAYPQLIYSAVANAYRTNSGLVNFVSGFNSWAGGVAKTLSPIGWIGNAINNALLSAAPTVGYIGSALGGLLTPLTTLDNMGKYLVLQNAAAWISVLLILVHGERSGKGYRYKK